MHRFEFHAARRFARRTGIAGAVKVAGFAFVIGTLACSPSGEREDAGRDGRSQAANSEQIRTDPIEVRSGWRAETAAGLSFHVPEEWEAMPPASTMRVAQFALPGGEGEEPAELVVFYFGEGQGGGTQANIDRWIAQMHVPEGEEREDPRTEQRTVNGLRVTTVEASGTYLGSSMPGPGHDDPLFDYRMWGAVVEGPGGPWFFKAVGPGAVMEEHASEFEALLTTMQPV